MQLMQTITEVIDMRSFSNLWFWIALAVLWSTASHFVLGVPHDLIRRAIAEGGNAMADVQSAVQVNIGRQLYIARRLGAMLVGTICFMFSMLIVIGFGYRVEFAQALTLLGVPMSLNWALALRNAAAIEREGTAPETLLPRLRRQRMTTQAIGMIAIFVTATYGMYQNLEGMRRF